MIVVRQFARDHNTTYTSAAQMKGLELQAIVDAHDLKVGKVQDMEGGAKDVVLSDTTKLEAALAKAGFAADSNGLWFHEGTPVPAPRQLLHQTALKRFQQAETV